MNIFVQCPGLRIRIRIWRKSDPDSYFEKCKIWIQFEHTDLNLPKSIIFLKYSLSYTKELIYQLYWLLNIKEKVFRGLDQVSFEGRIRFSRRLDPVLDKGPAGSAKANARFINRCYNLAINLHAICSNIRTNHEIDHLISCKCLQLLTRQ